MRLPYSVIVTLWHKRGVDSLLAIQRQEIIRSTEIIHTGNKEREMVCVCFTPRTFTRKMDKGNRGLQRLKSSHPFLYHHTSRINPVNSGCRKQTGLASDSVDCSYQLRALKCKRCIGWDKIIYQAYILPLTTGTCFHGFGLTEKTDLRWHMKTHDEIPMQKACLDSFILNPTRRIPLVSGTSWRCFQQHKTHHLRTELLFRRIHSSHCGI